MTLGASFLVVLPSVWWLVSAGAEMLYDTVHDPRFLQLYRVSLGFFVWLHERTGGWYSSEYAVATQDGLVALVCAAAVAVVLVRWRRWQTSRAINVGLGVVSVLVPWQPMIRLIDWPEYYALPVGTLGMGYVVAIALAAAAPISRGMRAALLGLGLTLGAILAVWGLEPWEWVRTGSLLAAFLLLAYGVARSLRREPGVA